MSASVLIFGNTSSEFVPALSLLAQYIVPANSQILQLPEIYRIGKFLKKPSFKQPFKQQFEQPLKIAADFFILLQCYPSQFSISDIVALKKNNPFSPVLLISGCCCEGAARTAPVLPDVFRFYTFQVNEQLCAGVSSFLIGKNSLFTPPYPVSDEEIILCQANGRHNSKHNGTKPAACTSFQSPPTDKQYCDKQYCDKRYRDKQYRQCCIVNRFGPLGNDSTMNDLLADIYRHQGFTILPNLNQLPENFDGKIVADVDDSPFPQILESFQRIRGRFADSDITGYINSPRINEKNVLRNAGVNLVFPKL